MTNDQGPVVKDDPAAVIPEETSDQKAEQATIWDGGLPVRPLTQKILPE
jgi:hypothetical protein